MSDLNSGTCPTFKWCDGLHLLEDNSWFELSDGRVQCDHSARPEIEQVQGLDVALTVSEYRGKSGISFSEPEIYIYSPGIPVNPDYVKLLLQELSKLVSLANVAVTDLVNLEQCS